MTGSVWLDIVLFVVFITVLSVATFRLDTIMSTPRTKQEKPQKNFCGIQDGGKMSFTDPDGRDPRRKRRSEPSRIQPSIPASRRTRPRAVRDGNS